MGEQWGWWCRFRHEGIWIWCGGYPTRVEAERGQAEASARNPTVPVVRTPVQRRSDPRPDDLGPAPMPPPVPPENRIDAENGVAVAPLSRSLSSTISALNEQVAASELAWFLAATDEELLAVVDERSEGDPARRKSCRATAVRIDEAGALTRARARVAEMRKLLKLLEEEP